MRIVLIEMQGTIYASGLGLLFYSPPALRSIDERADVMRDLEPGGQLYTQWVLTRQAVLLGTGSPQMYYRIRVHIGDSTPDATVLERVSFSMRIDAGLAVRDGYAPMQWQTHDPEELRFDIPAGSYDVEARWTAQTPDVHEDMVIDLALHENGGVELPGDGWPTLFYEVNRAPE